MAGVMVQTIRYKLNVYRACAFYNEICRHAQVGNTNSLGFALHYHGLPMQIDHREQDPDTGEWFGGDRQAVAQFFREMAEALSDQSTVESTTTEIVNVHP